MKKYIILILLSLLCTLNPLAAMEATQCTLPYLILHVDINKTIIAEDKAKEMGPEETIAAMLATKPEYAHTWDNDLEKMTFKTWVDTKLFPGTNPALKKIRDDYHTKFIEVAREQNHPMFQNINNTFESLVSSLTAREPRKILKSFSNFINYLRRKQYSFSIILRTFGQDLVWVSEELAQDNLTFTPGSFKKGVLYLNNKVLTHPKEMLAVFKPGQNYAIQDNYDWWKESNFTEKGGKPFPIDISDKNILSIFFDDNAIDPTRAILHIIPVGKEKTNLHELINMGRIVPVDTCEAILDQNYFIDAVENALQQWKKTFCSQEPIKNKFNELQ